MAYTTTKGLRTFHLFAGAGGGLLADLLLGHIPIGACEIEPYPRNVLLARQRDGILPSFPIWDDVCSLDGTPWRGSVDVLCGGFPCQDISAAGKGAGISGERSGLWKEYARLIGEMRPRFVFAENSPLLRTRGLGVVLEDLAALGYNARWGIIGARNVGAPHKRDRMWVLAYRSVKRCDEGRGDDEKYVRTEFSPSGEHRGPEVGNSMHQGLQGSERAERIDTKRRQEQNGSAAESSCLWWPIDPAVISNADKFNDDCRGHGASEVRWKQSGQTKILGSEQDLRCADWPAEPLLGRVAHGVAHRVDRLKAIGNGQVPQCAAVAFNILSEGLI